MTAFVPPEKSCTSRTTGVSNRCRSAASTSLSARILFSARWAKDPATVVLPVPPLPLAIVTNYHDTSDPTGRRGAVSGLFEIPSLSLFFVLVAFNAYHENVASRSLCRTRPSGNPRNHPDKRATIAVVIGVRFAMRSKPITHRPWRWVSPECHDPERMTTYSGQSRSIAAAQRHNVSTPVPTRGDTTRKSK